jgi:integrase/polyhydroxyalkanoate synthesis regulator phasin
MVTLGRDSRGNYKARKRLPDDVRDEYGRLYGPSVEAKFHTPASTKRQEAERQFHEWKAETDARIAAIRAQRKGEGIPLTRQHARALAGEWYEWFLARHSSGDMNAERARDEVQDAMRQAVGEKRWEENHPDELWEQEEDLRKALRPVLADVGETSQFLATKSLVLNNEARSLFLDFLYKDLAAALGRLVQQSEGDYSPDTYRERFPKFEGKATGDTPVQLFDRWCSEQKPAAGTVESWQYVFREMERHFEGRTAASITPDEAQRWVRSLVTPERGARTVHNTWITASKAVFGWAVDKAKVTIPRRTRLRETQAFYPEEQRTILKAALEIEDTTRPDDAARRWVPWLCAYTGARVGEITQLRGRDVIKRDGTHALRITPEAGTVKGGRARLVPLHEHLLKQGFTEFVEKRGDGPLFYKPAPSVKVGTKPRKPRYQQARQRVAAWVRSLGITDPTLQPNHAWRHTFKQIADRCGISERVSDAITGHAPATVSRGYGSPTLSDIAAALKKFPRYEW